MQKDNADRFRDIHTKYSILLDNWTIILENGGFKLKGYDYSNELVTTNFIKLIRRPFFFMDIEERGYHIGKIADNDPTLPDFIKPLFANGFPSKWVKIMKLLQKYSENKHKKKIFTWCYNQEINNEKICIEDTNLESANNILEYQLNEIVNEMEKSLITIFDAIQRIDISNGSENDFFARFLGFKKNVDKCYHFLKPQNLYLNKEDILHPVENNLQYVKENNRNANEKLSEKTEIPHKISQMDFCKTLELEKNFQRVCKNPNPKYLSHVNNKSPGSFLLQSSVKKKLRNLARNPFKELEPDIQEALMVITVPQNVRQSNFLVVHGDKILNKWKSTSESVNTSSPKKSKVELKKTVAKKSPLLKKSSRKLSQNSDFSETVEQLKKVKGKETSSVIIPNFTEENFSKQTSTPQPKNLALPTNNRTHQQKDTSTPINKTRKNTKRTNKNTLSKIMNVYNNKINSKLKKYTSLTPKRTDEQIKTSTKRKRSPLTSSSKNTESTIISAGTYDLSEGSLNISYSKRGRALIPPIHQTLGNRISYIGGKTILTLQAPLENISYQNVPIKCRASPKKTERKESRRKAKSLPVSPKKEEFKSNSFSQGSNNSDKSSILEKTGHRKLFNPSMWMENLDSTCSNSNN